MLRLVRDDDHLDSDGPYRFPVEKTRDNVEPLTNEQLTEQLLGGLGRDADDVLAAVDHMSRRMEDLARELNCLGHFEDGDNDGDDDGPPRAA